MRTRGQSYGRTPACTSWLPTPEPASTRNFSSPRERSVAGPRRLGLGGGEPVPRRTARMVGERVTRRPTPHPTLSPCLSPRLPLEVSGSRGERELLLRGRSLRSWRFGLALGRCRLGRRCRGARLIRAYHHLELLLLAAAHDREFHGTAHGCARDDALQIAHAL